MEDILADLATCLCTSLGGDSPWDLSNTLFAVNLGIHELAKTITLANM